METRGFCIKDVFFFLLCFPCIINSLVSELKCRIVGLYLCDTALLVENAKNLKRSLQFS